MTIGISAPFRLHGGGLIHLRHLLHAWHTSGTADRNGITVFLRQESIPSLNLPPGHAFRLEAVGARHMGTLRRLAWEQAVLPGMAKRAGIDVLFCPGNLVPLRSPVPTVVAFRNAGPFCSNMRLRILGWHDWAFFRAMGPLMRISGRAANRVVFISQYFKDLFVRRFGFPSDRGDVIYHGRDAFAKVNADSNLLQNLGIRQPFCLSVAHLYPYKNFPALIEGYALARKVMQTHDMQLVMVGKPNAPAYLDYLRQIVKSYHLEEWILFAGAVPHHNIGRLMDACEFFVFQSTCENCPNTLIEALAAGLPVACSNAGVMPEIAGQAACYFHPNDPASISEQLTLLASSADLRANLRNMAQQQALKFPTWEQVGQLTLESLARAAEGRHR